MRPIDVLKVPVLVLWDLLKFIVMYMPGNTGIKLRRHFYKRRFRACGANLVVDIGVSIEGHDCISVGDNVFIDKYCVISTGRNLVGNIRDIVNTSYTHKKGDIVIGNNVHIAQFSILMGYGGIQFDDKVVLSSGCKIYSLTNLAYDINDRSRIVTLMPYAQSEFLLSPVVLETNVWLGLNTIVMPGTIVGKDSFSVSNSVLTKRYVNNSYIEGTPSLRTRNRFSSSIRSD